MSLGRGGMKKEANIPLRIGVGLWIEDFTQPRVHDEVCSWSLRPH